MLLGKEKERVEKAHQFQPHITSVVVLLSKTHHMASSRCKGAGKGCLATCLARQRQHRFWKSLEASVTFIFKDSTEN